MTNSIKPTRARKCRPGYKSPSKILRSANRLQKFIADKFRQENLGLKSENAQLKQDLTNSFEKSKIDNKKLKIQVESLENQLTFMKNKLYDKEEAINTANNKINSLEENKISIEDKLKSYRATLRKLIIEKEGGKVEDKVEDKGKQK